jgi:two-component system, NtrC family, nitrogen regulation sensor histidine kinase NtrY
LKKSGILIAIGILLIALGWAADFNHFFYPKLTDVAIHLAAEIEQKKQSCRQEIDALHKKFEKNGLTTTRIRTTNYYSDLFEKKGIILAVYEQNELVFWSDNRVAFDYLLGPGIPEEQYLLLENGWYGLQWEMRGEREYYSFFLIKSAYPYHNQFLSDEFQRDFNLDNGVEITLANKTGTTPVLVNNSPVFHITRATIAPQTGLWLNLILLILGVVLFIIGMEQVIVRKFHRWYWLMLWPLILILLRWFSLPVGSYFSGIQLFDPSLYASSAFFPSLGDFFLNGLLLAYIAYFVKTRVVLLCRIKPHRAVAALSILPVLILGLIISPLIIGLIENSSIIFNLSDLFDVNGFSVLGIGAVGLLLYAYYLLAVSSVWICGFRKLNIQKRFSALVLALMTHVIVALFIGISDLYLIMWPVAAIALVIVFHGEMNAELHFKNAAVLLFAFTGLVWFFILKYESRREHNIRTAYAEKLASDEDPVTELLFVSVEAALQEDTLIRQTLLMPDRFSNEILSLQIANEFTDRYWNKYNLSIHTYKPDSSYWGILPDMRPPSFNDFELLIQKHGFQSTTSPNLYHLYNYPENLSYLARIPILKKDNQLVAIVFIGFQARIFPDEIGYPELLIDESSAATKGTGEYSFARYVDNKLIASQGDYVYRIIAELYQDNQERFEFENYNGYSHLVHRADDRTIIVVSKKKSSFFESITVFSYLFALFGLTLFILQLLSTPVLFKSTVLNHLSIKIQLLSGSIILVTLVTFGLVTRFYAERQFKEKNYSVLREKTQSVLIELEAQHKHQTALTPALIDHISTQLNRLSYVFFSDINVYNPKGELVATSQPKIFDSGLIAPRMNSRAFVKISINHKSDYVHEEKIGSLTHLSAYVPFRNENNDILAYVNLPYFARQDALEQELSQLIVTIVNIFVLLFALSIVAALFISEWITRPLQLLQASLSRIELGKQNEPIAYSGGDVIGELVKEYNRKVSELAFNAEQLARSERESAWREMAKQVAHEIKNPLTPMKLNLQLLQKAVADGADDLEARFERTSRSLIEQIDTLTQIANEFSNFANMPRAQFEEVALNDLVSGVVDLYRELPGQKVLFSPDPMLAPMVRADYKQLSRALQNLIKNSLQAARDNIEPEVKIEISAAQKGYVISITDNGTGISPDMRSRIFQPNFTTKTTGAGLGLAMVKSIVQNMNGKIWFEDAPNHGTIFFIEIPAVNSPN